MSSTVVVLALAGSLAAPLPSAPLRVPVAGAPSPRGAFVPPLSLAPGPLRPLAPDLRLPVPGVPLSPFNVDPLLHGALTGGAFAVIAGLELGLKPALGHQFGCHVPAGKTRCDPRRLNALDRLAVGNDSDGWAAVSDVALGVGLGGVLAASTLEVLLSDSPTKGKDILSDSLVLAESVAFATLAATALKFAVRRGRPSQYDSDAPLGGFDSTLSFPSGHTTTVAAAAFAFATTFWLRHPDSEWRWVVGAGAVAATALTAWSRVAAGRHFPTDVLAGAALGAGTGMLVPLLHRWIGGPPEHEGGVRLGMPSAGPIGAHGGRGVFFTLRF